MTHLVSPSYDQWIASGVSPAFAGVLSDPADYHPDLAFTIQQVDGTYLLPDDVTEVVPLWSVEGDAYVRWNRDGVSQYTWVSHEGSDWNLIARSEQGILAELFAAWIEMEESEEEPERSAFAIGRNAWKRGMTMKRISKRGGWA